VPARPRLSRDESRAQTREALVAAATDLFDTRGFVATSIADIAEAAGYTTGALYSNFTSKEDLFLEIVERDFVRSIEDLQSMIAGKDTVSLRMAAVRAWYHAHVDGHRGRTRALAEFSLLVQQDRESWGRVKQQRSRALETLTALFAQPALATAMMALADGFAVHEVFDDANGSATLIAAIEVLLQTGPRIA
jgi:AcrR family transcriptional regulator